MTSDAKSLDEKLSPRARSALGVVFVTLFIDLIGFSIIFPLFPQMLTFYRDASGGGGAFGLLHGWLTTLTAVAGSPEGEWGIIVLFGGLIGALYSLLQFLFAPLIGRLSDRYGRRPVLICGLTGVLLSHLVWVFAGSFELLLLSRLLGGVMSGNISTATAVVADVTTDRERSKGMAIIGVAFGLGFLVGPAIGGLLAGHDLTSTWPALAGWGINPFSLPAAVAALLAFINVWQLIFRFKETLPERIPDAQKVRRTANPFAIFHGYGYPGVTRTNLAYFLFFVAFSGMEFTLTFLATDRLGFGPRQNGMMFVFVGVISALIQGGYVRRMSPRLGSKRMALHGLAFSVPGMLLIGLGGAQASLWFMFTGLALLAAGVAQTAPCLTALASVYGPPEEQGRVLGVFRSAGALARAIGPLAGSIAYWRLGGGYTYLFAGLFVLLPLAITYSLPAPANMERKNPTMA